MYQKPDFVKVDLDIKENFAAYTSGCYRNSMSVYTNNETVVPTGKCEVDNIVSYASGESDYQCFVGNMSY
ncbi:MAG: hypothetical protein IJJ41_08540 [Clostridia bacterium]|nr:hypothetical protein [Clostridia bacterium]